jgi:hypothetical protein
MKRLIAGDKAGAGELFSKCVATGQDNYAEYGNAQVELEELKKP